MMRALVLGAGPGGMLSAYVLAGRGFRVSIADPEPGSGAKTRPQSRHAHVFREETWERLSHLLPGLTDELAKRGYPPLPAPSAAGGPPESPPDTKARPWPDRPALDSALWALCHPVLAEIHAVRASHLDFTEGRVRAPGCGSGSYDLVVDATGTARASLASVASAVGGPLPLLEGPASGGYVTFRITCVQTSPSATTHATRDFDTGMGVILSRSGLERWLLTLQLPQGATPPESLDSALEVLARLEDSQIHTLCRGARTSEPLARFGGRPATRLALEECPHLPDAWLPLGDCTLTTQPYLGQGVDQVVSQVGLLDDGLGRGQSIPAIRSRMAEQTMDRWAQATLTEALLGARLHLGSTGAQSGAHVSPDRRSS
jgi:2-polyprenyl-6-methoxyphenol hydroxylase-like FAD-dependent oxidoreductase